MDNKLSEDDTFNTLKYRHVAGVGDEYDYPPGTIYWLNDKKQNHKDDGGPAVIWPDGTKEWWINGKIHRDGAPAIEHSDGTKFWYRRGHCHRGGGKPAVEYLDGTKMWYVNGVLQRTMDSGI